MTNAEEDLIEALARAKETEIRLREENRVLTQTTVEDRIYRQALREQIEALDIRINAQDRLVHELRQELDTAGHVRDIARAGSQRELDKKRAVEALLDRLVHSCEVLLSMGAVRTSATLQNELAAIAKARKES